MGWVFVCVKKKIRKETEFVVLFFKKNGFGYLSAESVQAGQNKNQLEKKKKIRETKQNTIFVVV